MSNLLVLGEAVVEIIGSTNASLLEAIQFQDADGNALSLDGIVFEAAAKSAGASPSRVLHLTMGDGLSVGGPSNSVLIFTAPQSAMGAIAAGRYFFDCTGTDDAATRRILAGGVTVRQGMTA